jgi:hypothetical protein
MHPWIGFRLRRLVRTWLGACACLLAFAAFRGAAAEEDLSALQQREQEEAKAEDAADAARGEIGRAEKAYSGRLVLGQVVEGREDVVGLFTLDKGRAYPVKLGPAVQLKELKSYDHKTVTLQGKLRNQGKYFVASAIIHTPAPTQAFNKANGL